MRPEKKRVRFFRELNRTVTRERRQLLPPISKLMRKKYGKDKKK